MLTKCIIKNQKPMDDITKMSVNELLSHRDELQQRCDYNAHRIDLINKVLKDRNIVSTDELPDGCILMKIDPRIIIQEMWEELGDLKLRHVKSFRELHDHTDANLLADEMVAGMESDIRLEILNHCQEVVDNMLKMENG